MRLSLFSWLLTKNAWSCTAAHGPESIAQFNSNPQFSPIILFAFLYVRPMGLDNKYSHASYMRSSSLLTPVVLKTFVSKVHTCYWNRDTWMLFRLMQNIYTIASYKDLWRSRDARLQKSKDARLQRSRDARLQDQGRKNTFCLVD